MNTFTCEMSDDQVVAMGLFEDWLTRPVQEFRLGGLAGTGKTTLVKSMIERISHVTSEFEVITPTAKAAEVLGRKGVKAKTSHSLLCNFEYEAKGRDGRVQPVFSDKDVTRRFIICDEASMVTSEMRDKILRCADRVVWVGDYGQLPPVERGGFGGVLCEDNLDAKLSVQHRHGDALQIVEFANYLRNGGDPLKWKNEGEQVHVNRKGVRGIKGIAQFCLENEFWPVICFTNAFIAKFNLEIRNQLGMQDLVECGMKLVCTYNAYSHGVANGELFTVGDVLDIDEENQSALIWADNGRRIPITFDQQYRGRDVKVMDGYAITCHKSQGSEWPRVCVIEEQNLMSHAREWRYTGATRAQNNVEYFTKGAV